MGAHVTCMDFVLGTALTNRASCAMVTCNNTAMLTVTKLTADPSFEEALYQMLVQDGVCPQEEELLHLFRERIKLRPELRILPPGSLPPQIRPIEDKREWD